MKSPRERTLARIKTLAAAGVVAGCHGAGYAVVDPMPMPSCFESSPPTVTAKLLEKTADGTRVVEVVAQLQSTETKVSKLSAVAMGKELELVEPTINAHDFRAVVKVPKGIGQFSLDVACGQGSGFTQYVDVTDTGATVVP